MIIFSFKQCFAYSMALLIAGAAAGQYLCSQFNAETIGHREDNQLTSTVELPAYNEYTEAYSTGSVEYLGAYDNISQQPYTQTTPANGSDYANHGYDQQRAGQYYRYRHPSR